VALGGVGGTTNAGNFTIYSAEDLSPRGTRRVDFRLQAITKGPVGTKALDGNWRFVARRVEENAPSQPSHLNAMSWDDLSGWYGFSTWQNALNTGTVTWPGTADSAITVAAYSPQNNDINSFSGRGKRVDGVSVVDLAAPGSTTYTGQRSQNNAGVPGGYGSFGGTSAATPHVAGAAALLKQWDPTLGSGEMRALLREGARLDSFTGAAPNDTWGAGKLNVYDSMLTRATAAPMAIPATQRGPRVEANVPNPFNPSTLIRYELPTAGRVRVEILDLRGRRVAVLSEKFETAGSHELRWNGRDDAGIPLASGIYLVRVQEDGRVAARKVTLLK
jgi:subtilisin family serine protease